MMKPSSALLFIFVVFLVCSSLIHRQKKQLRLPIKSMMSKYRSPARMPANVDLEEININGKRYLLRKDLELTKESDAKKKSYGQVGKNYVIFKTSSNRSRVTVLQSPTTGKYAALYPTIRVKTSNPRATTQDLIRSNYKVLRSFEMAGIIIAELPEGTTTQDSIAELQEFTYVSRVTPSIIENRVIAR